MRLNVAVALIGLALVTAPCAAASSVNEIDLNAGILFVGSVPPAGYGQGNTILQTFGVSLPIEIAGPFSLEPMVELFGLYYEWVPANAVAVPTQYETAAGFFTLASIVSLHSTLRFALTPVLSLGGSLGLDFLLRFPLDPSNTDPGSVAGRATALDWFFSDGRFFYPETRLFLAWQATDTVGVRFNVRALFPVFHLWDGAGDPFIDQLMISAGVQLGVRLGPPKTR